MFFLRPRWTVHFRLLCVLSLRVYLVNAVGYFKCTNDVQLFRKTECSQDCMTDSTGTIHEATSKAIPTDTFSNLLSSMKTSTKVVNDDTTFLEISGDSPSGLGVAVLKTSPSSEELSSTLTHHSYKATQPLKVTPFGSTESQFNDQTTPIKTRSTQAAEQLKFSTSTTDLKTSTEKTFTSQSHLTTERYRKTTHELPSTTVLMTENKVQSQQTSSSRKFQSNTITTKKEPTATTTGRIQHTIHHPSTIKDHPTTKEEDSTSKKRSKWNVTTKTTHNSKLNSFTTETRSVRRNPTSISTHTIKQETITKEARTTIMSSTTDQEINTSELRFSTMTTSSRRSYFTTANPTTPPSCPTNMIYMNCTCQSTCEYPNRLTSCYTNCSEAETCVCPYGFYLMGVNCVPPEECSCYFTDEDVIIQEGETQLLEVCSKQCSCLSGVLTCHDFQCNSNAICQYESGIAQCHCNDGYHGDGLSCTRLTDCKDVYDAGLVDAGVYTILPRIWTGSAFEVYCKDGWTVFQRREDGSVDFFLYWADYKEGFGDLRHEMWLGLEKLHFLTYQSISRLKISLVSDGIPYEMNYSWFEIDNEANNYSLKKIGTYSGNIDIDPLAYSHTYQFSTRDRDNDNHPSIECAKGNQGAWWYKQCFRIDLNGPYGSPVEPGICYIQNLVRHCNISFTEMSIKPV